MNARAAQPADQSISGSRRRGLQITERSFVVDKLVTKFIERQSIGTGAADVANMVDVLTGFIINAIDPIFVTEPDGGSLGYRDIQGINFASDRIIGELR